MGTWDCVETDFGDETGNFGPRQESGSALYEVNTIATIGSREQTTECIKPQLSCSVIGDRTCLAANQHLSVFRDLQFSQTMEFDNRIDALAWSPDEAFLVLGDGHGTLWVVEAESLNIIFSTEVLPPSKTYRKAFQKILVKKLEIGYDILILSSSGQMLVIREVTPAILLDSSKSLRERVVIEMADTSSIHKRQTHSIFFLGNNIVTLGSGESVIGVWSSVDGRLEALDEAGSFLEGDAGVVSGCCSTNGKFLILLDEKNRLTVWDAFLLTLLSTWEEAKVESFFLLETDDNNTNSLLGVKVVMLTHEGGGNSCLQVKNLPTWETSYKLQLHPTHLADTLPNQESLYIVEWCEKDEKTDVKVLRLRCLTEALPETRLTRLLNKNRFDEAMEFAKLFRLDTELVCKVKCKYLLDQLSSWNVARYEAPQVTQMIADLHECLAAISDVPYIVSSLTAAALPSIADTHKVLLYVKKRMQAYLGTYKEMSDSQRKKASSDMNKLLGVIYRLTTFKQAFGQNHYTAEKWERFMKCNLLEQVFIWLKQGDLARSLGIWTRHQHEWTSMLSAGVLSDLLSIIPDDVKARQLTTWLTSDLIPFIITTIPKGLEVLLKWIIEKALNMELLEKGEWPVNAIDFLKAVHQSGVASASINSAHQEATPSETVIKTQVNVVEALLALHAQVVKLEHLYNLRTTYKFHLTNKQFEQETTESVAFRMLDKVVAIELMAPALRQQIRPYMAEHGLKEDQIFFKYIQDLLERSTCEVMYHGEAPWEAKAAAVIKYIKNPELKCESIYRVMKFASIPWTQEMQNLVQSGLKLDHPKVELLKDQCGVNRINEILLKYELKKLKVEDMGPYDIMRLLYFILSKDQASSVDDALEIISLKGLDHSAQVDMYLFRLRFLVQAERGSEALALIRQLPTYLSETCARRLVMYTEVLLSEPLRFVRHAEERMKALFAASGSKVCSHLMEKLRDHLEISHYEEVKKEFDNILALQFEFGEIMILPDYRNYAKREKVLKKLLQTFYLKKGQDKICVCYSKVFRLAEILQICRAKLLGQLAVHSAGIQHMDRALHLCNLLLESEPTEEAGKILHHVALSLSQLQDTLPAEGKLSVDLLRRLPDVIYELACQSVIMCSPELMNQCLLLCKVTELWRKLCSQCESGDYSLAVQVSDSTSQDPYTVWNLDTLFREDALVLDSRLALPLASFVTTAYLKLVELCSNPTAFVTADKIESCTEAASALLENLSRTTQDLTSYLVKNGHVGLAVEYLQQMTAVSAQFVMQQDMGYPVDNKAVSAMFAQQCETLNQVYSVGQSRIKEFTSSLLLKVLNERRIDQRLALAYFTCLPVSHSLPLLKRSASSHGLNYKSLMSLAQVGIALSGLTRNPASLARFRELEKNATWGHRISKYKINFREAFMAPSSMKSKLLTTMAQCEGISTAFIRDFCGAFQIEEDEGLFIYLDHLLLSPPPSTLDPNTLQQQQAQLSRAKSAIQDIHMRDILRERLLNLLDQINPYNYEVIEFILEELLMLPPVVVSEIEKGLKLLKHLKFYKRCAPPTEFEIKCSVTQESEELVRGVEWLHPLSKERLPYHPLMSEKPLKVIKPELNYSTITSWTPMADLLQIPPDSVIVCAIRNTVSQYLETNSSRVAPGVDATKEKSLCNWELDDAGMELLRKLHELFMKLGSCENALACCVTSVIGALPIGAEKVVALQQCVNFAEMWYKASDPDSVDREKAMTAYMKFSEFHRRLSTEQVLYQTKMAEPDLLQLATNPRALIKKLYQHPTILMHDGEIEGQRPDIHAVAEKIAGIHSLELDKVVKSLILEWMPGGGSAEDDAEATMTFSFTNMDFAKEESINEGEDSSLRRVIYLLQYQTLETSCQFIYHYVTNSKAEGNRSNECLVRALRCLLELADDDTIERVCAQPADNIRERLEVLMYLVELEALHIQHSVDTFTQCSKEGLIKGIWQNHSHKKNAVQLVSDLCLDYKVHDVLLWNSLLQKLQAFGLTRKLESLLMRISGVRELWQIPSLPKVWYDLIFSFLTKGVPPLQGDQVRECVHAINLLMKCPCPEELDLEGLCNQCGRLEMYACALSCVTLVIDRTKQVSLVQSVMSAGLPAVLNSLRKAEDGGLSATTISRVEEVLFVHAKITGRYGEMWDSARGRAFLGHLVEHRQLGGLIDFLQDNNRLTEAVDVVDTYLRQCPDVPVHLRAACHNKPPEVKLQIFMQSIAAGNSTTCNGTV